MCLRDRRDLGRVLLAATAGDGFLPSAHVVPLDHTYLARGVAE